MSHGRHLVWRDWTDAYRITIAEVLLQRTRAETVAGFLPKFLDTFPSWQAIANSRVDRLRRALKPIGLSDRRSRSLKELARVMVSTKAAMPDESMPGVGQYISRAVRVSTRGDTAAMVDSNFVRLIRRVFAPPWRAEYRTDSRLQTLAIEVVRTDCLRSNWAVLDFAAAVCKPQKPLCRDCPLRGICAYGAGNTAAS